MIITMIIIAIIAIALLWFLRKVRPGTVRPARKIWHIRSAVTRPTLAFMGHIDYG